MTNNKEVLEALDDAEAQDGYVQKWACLSYNLKLIRTALTAIKDAPEVNLPSFAQDCAHRDWQWIVGYIHSNGIKIVGGEK